jgi:small subunit ribosomal protein S1
MNDEERDLPGEEDEESFAELLKQSLGERVELKPGQKIEAKVLQIGAEWTFLDVGQKGEGVLDTRELLDGEGQPTVKVGEKLGAYFLSRAGGELRFTTRIGGGTSGTAQLEEAWRSKIPVEGRIEKEIKGGYEVRLPGGVRAFCPFSQIGLRRQDAPDEVIGQSRSFRITQFSEAGRNVVVSHREILEEERRQQRESLRQTLKEGDVVKGTVTSLRDFGAFVDIGGLEGLLPISEIGYGRVEDINAALRVGQELELTLKSCDWEKERFSFSLRDTLADPWKKVGSSYVEGGSYPGKVARLTAFGAFVTLEEGIDGLIHISKLGAGKRINHPQEVLKLGQKLTVTVEKIESEQRRISLVPTTGEETSRETSYSDQPTTGGMGTFAELLRASQEKKKKKR